jgi:hypothetical protein
MSDFRHFMEDHVVLMRRGVDGPPIVDEVSHDPVTGAIEWSVRLAWTPPTMEVLGRRADLEAHYTFAQIAAMTAEDYRKAFKCLEEKKDS